MKKISKAIYLLILATIFVSCGSDPIPVDPGRDLTSIAYPPVEYVIEAPETFPILELPSDNPMTVQGVALGRKLFYDPILSADSTMSCSSCHMQASSFTDDLAVSTGIDGIAGKRSSMSLLNVAFYYNDLFWDGRSRTLEDQALLPVEDPIELHAMWPDIVTRLSRHDEYPELFREAFGIENSLDITKEMAAKAISQFERTMVSSGNSKYDKVIAGQDIFTEEEQLGFEIFFDLNDELPDGECFHCHNAPLFTTNEYLNNGLDAVDELEDFTDKGRGIVTGVRFDNGKFRIPTLRNIALTAPYMHDGRFETLEEVMDHYNSGGHLSPNKDPLIVPLGLTDEQVEAVLAFIHTLTDQSFLDNPAYADPN